MRRRRHRRDRPRRPVPAPEPPGLHPAWALGAALVGLAGLFFSPTGLLEGRELVWMFAADLALALVLVALLAGRAVLHRKDLGYNLFALLMFFAAGAFLLPAVDRWADTSVVAPVPVEVVDSHRSSMRGADRLSLRVEGLPGRPDEWVEVSRDEYDTFKDGGKALAELHPGALGIPWVRLQAPRP